METKRIVWITGASRGIGKAIAGSFLKNGDIVFGSSRNVDELNRILDQKEDEISRFYPKECNITDENNIIRVVEDIKARFGKLDILINNAGIGIFKEIVNTSAEEFMQQINTNLMGTFLVSKNVIPLMKDGGGEIINIISVAAIKAFTNSGTYGATKAGALLMTKVLREEVKKYNIKVTAVIPGATKTDIWNPKVLEKYGNVMMNPEDIAESVLNITKQSKTIITEEIILRPLNGDL